MIQVGVGDFIQTIDHFGDIFFEVVSDTNDGDYRCLTYITYDKHNNRARTAWVNDISCVSKVIGKDNAIPVMVHKCYRFKAVIGKYDPIYGFSKREV